MAALGAKDKCEYARRLPRDCFGSCQECRAEEGPLHEIRWDLGGGVFLWLHLCEGCCARRGVEVPQEG